MEKLRSYLHKNGISHEAFGGIVGVTQVTINRYVRGDRFPSPQMVLKIAKATKGEVSVNDWYSPLAVGSFRRQSKCARDVAA
ncbi:helix-turn-helix transcriptional regulator [Ochrobactrum sp. AN78]|uniref:helix-turn-helix domain-containing protein n=1 Tax=Ochrobactrum sp. AN78 TaxID=3039853 RepID=UPI002989CDD1|nr:helix-turn-helix transcriptional regulator [Ochrobactrum sp. AN78]